MLICVCDVRACFDQGHFSPCAVVMPFSVRSRIDLYACPFFSSFWFSSHTSMVTLLRQRWMLMLILQKNYSIYALNVEWPWLPSSCGFCQLFISIVCYVILHSLRPTNELTGWISNCHLFFIHGKLLVWFITKAHTRNRSMDAFSPELSFNEKLEFKLMHPK